MKRAITITGAVGIVLTTLADTDSNQLREEFMAYKAASESRIQALENQLTNRVDLTQEELEGLRMLNERGTFDFEFHGYLRSGYGIAADGASQVTFQAPNSNAKYRLGNEAETYLETTFVAKTPEKTTGSPDKKFSTILTMAYAVETANSGNFDTQLSLREAYGIAEGLIPDNPTATWWAGQRFYSRIQVHMTDFWYRDMSGYGGGIENVAIGDDVMQLGFAWIGGSIDELNADGTIATPGTVFRKDSFDLDLTEISSLGGEFRTQLTYSYFHGQTVDTDGGGTNTVNLTDSHGASINFFQINQFENGINNTAVLQLGYGAAFNFLGQMTMPNGVDLKTLPSGTVFDTEDIQQYRFVEDLIYDNGGKFSGSATAIYQYSDANVPMGQVHWTSLGVRPIYHFNENYSIATEAGWDYTDQKDGESGSLFKLTFAPQITPQISVLSRPSLRLFFTYAWWGNEFKGQVGTPAYANDTAGFSTGIQLETWW
ncbi:carbohydrate porin [Pontiellaceae bacterium B12219]|nr:carbohydrate porin [Pontiellaceae bacterium B12219]